MSRLGMIEQGLALGLVLALILMVTPTEKDDFSRFFRPAGLVKDSYEVRDSSGYPGGYFYPVWNTCVLRGLALLPRAVGLVLVWAFSVIVVLACAPTWGTPGWLCLLSPPFIACLFYSHPFEAAVFAGVSLAAIGQRKGRAGLMGLGLALCLFKLQIGALPAVWIGLSMAGSREGRRAWWVPIGMVMATTLLEWAFYGQLWIGHWWEAMRQAPELVREWNVSLVRRFQIFSVLWLPAGVWLGWHIRNFQRRLWLAMAMGLLISPYWAIYSLWPLVAMVGCWREGRKG